MTECIYTYIRFATQYHTHKDKIQGWNFYATRSGKEKYGYEFQTLADLLNSEGIDPVHYIGLILSISDNIVTPRQLHQPDTLVKYRYQTASKH